MRNGSVIFVSFTEISKTSRCKKCIERIDTEYGTFFVPAGVGLMASFDLISRYWAALLIVSVVTTAVIIAVVGYMQDKLEKKL